MLVFLRVQAEQPSKDAPLISGASACGTLSLTGDRFGARSPHLVVASAANLNFHMAHQERTLFSSLLNRNAKVGLHDARIGGQLLRGP